MAVYPSSISLSSLNGKNGFRLDGPTSGDSSGISVASAGDVNGDGYDDVIVGAPGGGLSGQSYVVFGTATGWTASFDLSRVNGKNGFLLHGELNGHSGNNTGRSVASAGDVNNDGYDDLLIGAPDAELSSNNGDDNGASYLLFGKAGGWSSSVDLNDFDGSGGMRFYGGDPINAHLGYSVSSAGDVNRDGFDDMIIGAYGSEGGGLSSGGGKTYIVFGGRNFDGGFGSSTHSGQYPDPYYLSKLDGTLGFRLLGADDADNSGESVASAGDVNGDGYDDIIVGGLNAGDYTQGHAAVGASYVIFGKKSGWLSYHGLESLDGRSGFRIDGVNQFDHSGDSVAGVGDLNGDGYDDVAIGAQDADPSGKVSAGAAYVVFGKAKGYSPTFDLSSLNGTNGFRIVGLEAGDRLGISVASAGDFNGDGFEDVIVGARDASAHGKSGAGETYILFGKPAGWSATVDVSKLNGNKGIRIDGNQVDAASGTSVASAGDINNDGLDDVIIGAPGASVDGNVNSGESFVIFGRLPSGAVTRTGSAIGQTIHGGDGDDTLIGKGGADRLIGNGGVDTASYAGAAKGVTADLTTRSHNTNDAKGDQYASIENLTGSSHNDILTGLSGANMLKGGSGNDRLTGLRGNDELFGGGGKDNFVFTKSTDLGKSGNATDTIFDFSHAQKDHVDFSSIDANDKAPGNQAFRFIGTAEFHGKAGELRYDKAASDTYVYGDVNGDGKADFVLHLDDALALKAGDFLL